MKIKKRLVWVLPALALIAGAIWAGNKVGRKFTSEIGLKLDELDAGLGGQYERYRGVIGEDSVTLYLFWQQRKIAGYSWIDGDSLPLPLWGEGRLSGTSRISAVEQDILNPAFRNQFAQDSIDGVYRDAAGKLSEYKLVRQEQLFEAFSQTSTKTAEVDYNMTSNYFWPGKTLTNEQKVNWLSALANSQQIKSIEGFDKYQEQLMLARKTPGASKIERAYKVTVVRYEYPYLSVEIGDKQQMGDEVMEVRQYLTYDLQEQKRLSLDDIFRPGYESALRQQLNHGKEQQWPDFYLTRTHLVFWRPFKDETSAPVAVSLQSMQHWLKS
jgi:hypothetical protein